MTENIITLTTEANADDMTVLDFAGITRTGETYTVTFGSILHDDGEEDYEYIINVTSYRNTTEAAMIDLATGILTGTDAPRFAAMVA